VSGENGRLAEVLTGYSGQHDELIPILQEVQDEFGYLSSESMTAVSELLRMPLSSVYGVVTFYSQFYLTPQGRHKVKVCQGTACHVRGSAAIMKAIEDKFGIQSGESTADFELTLEEVACFGSCALAPVMVVDGKVYGKMTPDQALEILDTLE
jgi:NADH-quinone oxidoreductase subunit E